MKVVITITRPDGEYTDDKDPTGLTNEAYETVMDRLTFLGADDIQVERED